MNLSRTLIAMAVAAAPVWAWAGGKAVVEGGTGGDKARMTYEFDGDLLRMDVPDQPDGYMIMRDGKIYSVAQQNGQPMVIDMAGMGKMLGGMAQRSMANIDQDVDQFISLEDTGRTETIAGIKGRVHVLTYVDDGQRKSQEIVLSNDKSLSEMSRSMMRMSEIMAQSFGVELPEGSKRMSAEITGKGSGVLRFGNEYRVVSIDRSTPSSSRFKLPAEPQQMPDLGNLFSGAAGASAGASASGSANTGGGNPLADLFGQKAQRQQDRVEQRTDQEVDQATDSAVDKALDKAFEKLFGG
ncbi:hypothetical protein [Sinimarinibacterium flocculans]|uniref:hypothetical protein n=1 Tax=Sinimarinibacterium flocculans TaxID=985250 RepID=UPI003513D846